MYEFKMPSLGADMDAGTLTEWFIKPGDTVNRGDIIAAVETAKGVIEVEVFVDGVVDQLLVETGQEVPVGTTLAMIRIEETEPAAVAAPAAVSSAASPAPVSSPPPSVQKTVEEPLPSIKKVSRVKISPVAKKMAEKLGVDIEAIQPSSPDGVIKRADIEKAAAAQKTEIKGDAEAIPAKKAVKPSFSESMRQAIAAAMSRSNRDIPHYYLEKKIDLSTALNWLEQENLKRSVKDRILPVVLMLKATALTLRDIPELNGFWLDNELKMQEGIHIGFAILIRGGGLITPAIHNVDQKSLDQLREDMHDLITRTRAGKLRSSEMTDATITMTNLGDRGVDIVHGVIYPPQVALVGFGKVIDQVWVENGMIAIRPVVSATLAGDHRATDGHRGGQFLNKLDSYLQEPSKL
jgi:pyruvate dehydrogenase E2 component (dihydrolipoamide acetyltransferase)